MLALLIYHDCGLRTTFRQIGLCISNNYFRPIQILDMYANSYVLSNATYHTYSISYYIILYVNEQYFISAHYFNDIYARWD